MFNRIRDHWRALRRVESESEAAAIERRSCGNCKFRRTRPHKLKKDFLECHKSAPSPGYGETLCDQWRAIWPAVKTWEDCGEHKLVGEDP